MKFFKEFSSRRLAELRNLRYLITTRGNHLNFDHFKFSISLTLLLIENFVTLNLSFRFNSLTSNSFEFILISPDKLYCLYQKWTQFPLNDQLYLIYFTNFSRAFVFHVSNRRKNWMTCRQIVRFWNSTEVDQKIVQRFRRMADLVRLCEDVFGIFDDSCTWRWDNFMRNMKYFGRIEIQSTLSHSFDYLRAADLLA